ncbi:hypothetical protein TREES_T100007658 [Tupaia chinensis]|uniref:Uncharacterized protein n=1 Tax=Tupaia chinensis TaxID=246437 RepID=L9KSG5_TUPCH|nr:hypothetical protein TREES_T100007658 [Tupaia chinensis]
MVGEGAASSASSWERGSRELSPCPSCAAEGQREESVGKGLNAGLLRTLAIGPTRCLQHQELATVGLSLLAAVQRWTEELGPTDPPAPLSSPCFGTPTPKHVGDIFLPSFTHSASQGSKLQDTKGRWGPEQAPTDDRAVSRDSGLRLSGANAPGNLERGVPSREVPALVLGLGRARSVWELSRRETLHVLGAHCCRKDSAALVQSDAVRTPWHGNRSGAPHPAASPSLVGPLCLKPALLHEDSWRLSASGGPASAGRAAGAWVPGGLPGPAKVWGCDWVLLEGLVLYTKECHLPALGREESASACLSRARQCRRLLWHWRHRHHHQPSHFSLLRHCFHHTTVSNQSFQKHSLTPSMLKVVEVTFGGLFSAPTAQTHVRCVLGLHVTWNGWTQREGGADDSG